MNDLLIISTFIGGILSFFSPCIIPVLPVYISILAEQEGGKSINKAKTMIRTLLFVIGLATSFVLLGFGAGALGNVFYSDTLIYICSAIVILLGLYQIGLIKLDILNRQFSINVDASKQSGLMRVFFLGFAFSLGWTPCVGPILAAVLSLTASSGNAGYGGLLMFVYSLGLAIPFLVISLFSTVLLSRIKHIHKHLDKLKMVGGIIIVIMGILLMTGNLNILL
jgi:cytochrome c-type biogenesis protein